MEYRGHIWVVTINRPDVRNAVDGPTAQQLAAAFRDFDQCEEASVAILCGAGGTFCAGADLTAVAAENSARSHQLNANLSIDGPMGPTRLKLTKPVIAAVSGYAVAGGLELALWCDLRIVEKDAIFGVFCRRFGVPLIDGGTQRLPRLIGLSRALDLILTGRPVGAEEALQIGLANRVAEPGESLSDSLVIAEQLSAFPQACLRSDREAVYRGMEGTLAQGMQLEFDLGLRVIQSGQARAGAQQFKAGVGRHGRFGQADIANGGTSRALREDDNNRLNGGAMSDESN